MSSRRLRAFNSMLICFDVSEMFPSTRQSQVRPWKVYELLWLCDDANVSMPPHECQGQQRKFPPQTLNKTSKNLLEKVLICFKTSWEFFSVFYIDKKPAKTLLIFKSFDSVKWQKQKLNRLNKLIKKITMSELTEKVKNDSFEMCHKVKNWQDLFSSDKKSSLLNLHH